MEQNYRLQSVQSLFFCVKNLQSTESNSISYAFFDK